MPTCSITPLHSRGLGNVWQGHSPHKKCSAILPCSLRSISDRRSQSLESGTMAFNSFLFPCPAQARESKGRVRPESHDSSLLHGVRMAGKKEGKANSTPGTPTHQDKPDPGWLHSALDGTGLIIHMNDGKAVGSV